MTLLSNILVGVDGRDGGWDGLALAQRLVRLGGGRVTVVCAYPAMGFEHSALMWNDVRTREDAERVLDEARDRLTSPDDAELCAVSGSMPGACLHDAASRCHADLLVLGGAQHGTVGRVLGGSVLTAALVDPPCPIAVSPRGHPNGSRRIARIGVAVDGSAAAIAAIHWAHELAAQHGGIHEVRLLAVDEHARSEVHTRGRSELLASAMTGSRRGESAPAVRWTQAAGPVARQLADLSLGLDLLVIGTHGRRRLSRLLHGSVSSDVARSAHCPVVAVPFTPGA
jgi:nucleotide-binding universal stress UspA family protein